MTDPSSWLFITGLVMAVSLISAFGPLVGLLLGLPALVSVNQIPIAVAALALSTIAAFVAEKRLHWYMTLLPKVRSGYVPPALYQNNAAPKDRGRLFRFLFVMLEIAVALTVMAALALLGQHVYELKLSIDAEQEAHTKAERFLFSSDGKEAQAIEAFGKILEKNPNDRRALMGLTKAQLKAKKLPAAVAAAKAFAEAKVEKPKEPEDIWGKVDFYVRPFLDKKSSYKPEEAYAYVLQNCEQYKMRALDQCAQLMLKIKEGDTRAWVCRVRHAAALGKIQAARQLLDQAKNAKIEEVSAVLCEGFILEKEGKDEEAAKTFMKVMRLDPGNEEAEAAGQRISKKMLKEMRENP